MRVVCENKRVISPMWIQKWIKLITKTIKKHKFLFAIVIPLNQLLQIRGHSYDLYFHKSFLFSLHQCFSFPQQFFPHYYSSYSDQKTTDCLPLSALNVTKLLPLTPFAQAVIKRFLFSEWSGRTKSMLRFLFWKMLGNGIKLKTVWAPV